MASAIVGLREISGGLKHPHYQKLCHVKKKECSDKTDYNLGDPASTVH